MEHITDQNFQEVFAKNLPLVLDFSATWCGPCKKVAPIMDELANEYAGQVIIGKCDVDDNDDLTSKLTNVKIWLWSTVSAMCLQFFISRTDKLWTSK